MRHGENSDPLLVDLESAFQSSSLGQRVSALRRITDLFLVNADCLTQAQVELFDDVLQHLVTKVEARVLAELGASFAPLANAPTEVMKQLARHDDVTVAGPVLTQSQRLTDGDLVEIAQSKSQEHLYAISGRTRLSDLVTDVLVERGDRQVACRVTTNPGASFSEAGFRKLVERAENDDVLSEYVGLRIDLPVPLLEELLVKATDRVRTRILESAPLEQREEVQRVLANVSSQITREASRPKDFTQARERALRLRAHNQLNDSAIREFAQARKYEDIVAAIAVSCSAPIGMIERLMQHVRPDGLIVACKVAQLEWPTVDAILSVRFGHHTIGSQELQDAQAAFVKLTVPTAQKVFQFWLLRATASAT